MRAIEKLDRLRSTMAVNVLIRIDRLLAADRGLPAAAGLYMLIMFMLHTANRGHRPLACMIDKSRA